MDSLEKHVKTFFSNVNKMKPSEKDDEYQTIRKDYYKTLEDAGMKQYKYLQLSIDKVGCGSRHNLISISDEKVHLANQMHDLVDRYLRRLDQELHKFKMELEADHTGITEVLEKRNYSHFSLLNYLFIIL